MARPRNKNNKGLPPNLYEGINGYYKYRRPDTGKWHSIGKDRVKAISAAKQLNSMLLPGRDIVGKVINEPVQVFNTFLDRFEFELMPERKLAVLTIKEHKKKLVHIRKELGDKLIDELSIKEISEFLDKFPSVSSNRYRSLLIVIFKYAVAKGLCKENPVEKTLPKMEEKKRQRLELEGFLDIYNHPEAELWFKNAMDLGLQTLQRREDLVNLKFSDIKEGYLYVIQHKTEKHGDSAYLKIKITPILQNVLSRCRDCFLSPFILHRKPDKHSKQNYKAESKQHFTQITPGYLTKAFSNIRDKLPRFKSIPMAKRPTFHEIRSLGIKQYENRGIDAQALAGHKTRAMTDKYKEGHKPQWTEVEAGLDLTNSDTGKQA